MAKKLARFLPKFLPIVLPIWALASAPASAYKLDAVPCMRTCGLTFVAGPHEAITRHTRESFEAGTAFRLRLLIDDQQLDLSHVTAGCRFSTGALGVRVRVNGCRLGFDGKFAIYVRAENHDKAAHRVRLTYRVTGGV